jgi:hypothetical protein
MIWSQGTLFRTFCGMKYSVGGVVMSQYEDLLIDALLDSGFSLEEAMRLIELQERVERERQRKREQGEFAQWLRHIEDWHAAN